MENNLIHKDFKKLFYKKEGLELLGDHYKNLWIILFILFFTFLAIGFANGSLEYLGKKMNDPFINWVNIDVPYRDSERISDIKYELNADSLKQKFHFSNITGHYGFSLYFQNLQKGGAQQAIGRTIDLDNPLLSEILRKNNVVSGRGFVDEEDFGIIVTADLLKKFGYPLNTPFIQMSFPLDQYEDCLLPLPIVGVVRELPGLASFAATPYLYSQRVIAAKGSPFLPSHTRDLIVYTPTDSAGVFKVLDAVKLFFKSRAEYKRYDPMFASMPFDASYRRGYNITISFFPNPDEKTLDKIFNDLSASDELKGMALTRNFKYKFYSTYEYRNYDNLSVNFNSLDNIRAFQEYFSRRFNIQIDMAQIEAKENYNFVSKLTQIISFILIVFSVLSISLFIYNILTRHLDKIKMNIGTFKAFGLSNKQLLQIYFKIILTFVTFSVLLALACSWLFGALKGLRLLLSIFSNKLEEGESYFSLWSFWTLLSLLLIFLVTSIVSYYSIQKMINKTPGDLIYNRT